MLTLGLTGTIHLAVEPVDGRKGIDGLSCVVRAVLGRDPSTGDLFVFKNRRGGTLKILAWMGDGFALYLRRLEKGTFAFPAAGARELAITPTQLAMILGGVEPAATRTRLCDLIAKCATLLDPVYRLMVARVKESFAIHADESPVQLLKPDRTAYAWLYLGDAANPYTVFDFTPGRGEEHPAKFLAGYQGFVHADGYSGYNAIHGGTRHLGCWAHVRRKFVEAQESSPAPASRALAYIRTLYAVEREIADKKLTGDGVVHPRRTRAGPILKAFGEWLEVEHRTALPKSPFGQAVSYARNQWPTLSRYLEDARFAIDNNVAERAVRPLAVGRRNWLFVGGDGGLATASVLMSLCAGAKRHGLNPWLYLTDMLNQLADKPADVNHLLPDVWAQRHGTIHQPSRG